MDTLKKPEFDYFKNGIMLGSFDEISEFKTMSNIRQCRKIDKSLQKNTLHKKCLFSMVTGAEKRKEGVMCRKINTCVK